MLRPTLVSALSSPGFRAYFFAAIPQTQALWAQRVTVGWLAWDVSGSAAFVGLVAALGLLPIVFAGPIFGVLVDRADIRRALRRATGCMAVLLSLGAILVGGPGLDRVGLAIFAVGVGFIDAAYHPVRLSIAPRLVPQADVPNVVALSALNVNLARMIAPVLAGLTLASVGATATLWLSATLYLPMLWAIRFMDPRPLPAGGGTGSIRAGIAQAARYVAVTPVARQALILTSVMAVLVRGYLELLPVMAEGVHSRGAEGLGYLTAAAGGGALLAALAKAAGVGQEGIHLVTRSILVAGMLALLGLGLSEGWPMALGWTGVLGFVSTFVGVGLQAAVQEALPDDLRGRVMSLWVVVAIGAVAVGSGAMGLAAGSFGLPAILAVSGAVGALAATLLILPERFRGAT
ncbi:MAG: MFS transporter [Pseudomonadota bacterium]